MSKSKNINKNESMLELWRPPQGAGDAVGCMTTTYTFTPGLFDEHCLARFLEIESDPDREDLAFLLERESRLGSVYAGVLIDHTMAGVEHSLRWDVLPVRITSGKQHAKLTLLAWSRHLRIIVSSANLSESGYRTNHEITATIDLSPEEANTETLKEVVAFLRNLILLVPGASDQPPEVRRAEDFLKQIEILSKDWKPIKQRGNIRQKLIFTIPSSNRNNPERSSLEEAIRACRSRGPSPKEIWVASPFFDIDSSNNRVAAELCKSMARGTKRYICFCVPAIRENGEEKLKRLAAPKSLWRTPFSYKKFEVDVEMLPETDTDLNRRPWHAKMLALFSDQYSGLMIGSSNFTCAGMGVGPHRNAEANLLTLVDRVDYSQETGRLKAVWPEMERVADPEHAEWIGASASNEEEEQVTTQPLPPGFLSAGYRAGEERRIILRFAPESLPKEWSVQSCGHQVHELLVSEDWERNNSPAIFEIDWSPVQPPEKLLVKWGDHEGFLTLNVEDSRRLPPPTKLENMSADDMLWILAATDPSAAIRAWTSHHQNSDLFDDNLDSATPIDLDPLRRYDLQATFLHRIRNRARILAQLRFNLERPVWGRQMLEWRLRGMIGIESLADRLFKEFKNAETRAEEGLLILADFLIVLCEVNYGSNNGCLSKEDFEKIYRPFLSGLAEKLDRQIDGLDSTMSNDLLQFWKRVVQRCRK
jgi:hypothetical protein